jgi:DNA-binding MarR family transcriptional regulator
VEVEQRGLAPAIGKIGDLITWTQPNLPGGVPSIVSQAAYIVAIQTIEGCPISLKGLIGCSEAGLRKPLQRLVEEGWVEIVRDQSDQRVRRAIATEKLLGALAEFADRIAERETQEA